MKTLFKGGKKSGKTKIWLIFGIVIIYLILIIIILSESWNPSRDIQSTSSEEPVYPNLDLNKETIEQPSEKKSTHSEESKLPLSKRKKIYLKYTTDPLWKYDDGTDRIPNKLNEIYMEKYDLTRAQLQAILIEGADKYW